MRKSRRASCCLAILVCLAAPAVSQTPKKEPAPVAKPAAAATAVDQKQATPNDKPLIDPGEPSVLGELQIITINSKVYKNIRNLRVWLPANYFAPVNRAKRYPVLYMQDGQNLFDNATAQFTEWKFDESVQFLTGSMRIHPMIVVGIDSTPRRANEYLPYPDANNPELGKFESQDVQGKKYGDFVVGEVMPLIEKKYRVLTGAHNTGLGGAGYGGSVALYTVLVRPGVFGKLLVESPALRIGNGQLLKDAEKATQFPEKMYLAVGTSDGIDDKASVDNVEAVQQLDKILRAKGLGVMKLDVVIDVGAKANEIAWSKRLQNALLFLYGSDIHLIRAK
jgi:predicted alpha/beta superfamily hydrolase